MRGKDSIRLIELKKEEESYILAAVKTSDGDRTEESVQELADLAYTAGARVCGTLIQAREAVHPGTYLGKGKLDGQEKTGV